MMQKVFAVTAIALLFGCTTTPKGVQPVTGFDANRYLGKWYEIARLDHSFERGLTNVTAEYSLRPDGSIRVVNRGFYAKENKWQEANGIAKFVGAKDVARLKVSFFRPFYGGYNVMALDPEYRWSVVCGPNRSYFWILAREKKLDSATLQKLVGIAKDAGFATEKLLYVEQQ